MSGRDSAGSGRGGAGAARPRVKICGITQAADADAAIRLGADFLGLNFYASSPRSIEPEEASRLRRHVGDRARVVGIFVNHSAAEVRRIDAALGLDLLQFHGDEGPAELAPYSARAIKVFRVAGALPLDEIAAYPEVWGFLFDSAPHTAGAGEVAAGVGGGIAGGAEGEAGFAGGGAGAPVARYGGTGRRWDWAAAGGLPAGRRVLVAGGVRPDNVAELIARLSPWGVDVGSGVESAPGRKDHALLERLFEEIAHAQVGLAS